MHPLLCAFSTACRSLAGPQQGRRVAEADARGAGWLRARHASLSRFGMAVVEAGAGVVVALVAVASVPAGEAATPWDVVLLLLQPCDEASCKRLHGGQKAWSGGLAFQRWLSVVLKLYTVPARNHRAGLK